MLTEVINNWNVWQATHTLQAAGVATVAVIIFSGLFYGLCYSTEIVLDNAIEVLRRRRRPSKA